jgi:hypothetical protein
MVERRPFGCHECGRSDVPLFRMNATGQPGVFSCSAHFRARCRFEGCRRSIAAHPSVIWICGQHWRLVPKWRKAPYFRLRRLARKLGRWTDELWNRHQRLLRRYVQLINAGGELDQAEINRVMGWDA